MASCSFQLDAMRGPHEGLSVRYCWEEADDASAAPVLCIGRRKKCWLRLLQDLEVSSLHAELQYQDGKVQIKDVKSTNGTKLNGTSLVPRQSYPLADGDLIGVGRTSLRFVLKEQHGTQSQKAATIAETDKVQHQTSSVVETPATKANGDVDKGVARSEDDQTSAKDVASEPTSNNTAIDLTGENEPDVPAAADAMQKIKGGVDMKYVVGSSPEEATCLKCKMLIGPLHLLEQQAHLNSCLGGRVLVPVEDSTNSTASSVTNDAKPKKSRKRGNTADGPTWAKKPRKPKQSDGSSSMSKPPRKPRKRKKVDEGEDIELALALVSSATLSKEEQTDLQLAKAAKKLEELDVQLARLSKRRATLVKSVERLEKTKEKLRKSQVLPPAQVRELLDLESALNIIFPAHRQVDPGRAKEHFTKESAAAKRYAPSRSGDVDTCESICEFDEKKRAELAMVATISMWARSSQQLFGLQRDTLLYRNSVLRAFMDDSDDDESDVGRAEDVPSSETRKEQETEVVSVVPVVDGDTDTLNWTTSNLDDLEAPAVVKRVFPQWRRDVAFLFDQSPDELEVALETMREAQKRGLITSSQFENSRLGAKEDIHSTINGDQQLACDYMAQIMERLIAEKRKSAYQKNACSDGEPKHVTDLDRSNGQNVSQQQEESDDEVEAEPYKPVLEELAKAVTTRDPPVIPAVRSQ